MAPRAMRRACGSPPTTTSPTSTRFSMRSMRGPEDSHMFRGGRRDEHDPRTPARDAMPAPYTLKNLADVQDSASRFGYGELQEARFANNELETERTGFSFLRVKPGKRQGFAHRHENAEEVYVVVSGSGRVKVDDEV